MLRLTGLLVAAVLATSSACAETSAPTQGTAPMTGSIRGVVRFDPGDPPESFSGASFVVRLEDVSEADAASEVLAEYVRRDISFDPTRDTELPFELPAVPRAAAARCIITAHVDMGGDRTVDKGDFVTMQSHPVPAAGQPDPVITVRRV
jgi:uncharacterized lipoprotein YbaY